MTGDYIDGCGLGSEIGARFDSLAFAALFAGVGYIAYRSLYPGKRRRKGKRRSTKRRLKASRGKRYSSKKMSRARATTIPMRYFQDKRGGGLKLKAEDWVREQAKLKTLNGKKSKRRARAV